MPESESEFVDSPWHPMEGEFVVLTRRCSPDPASPKQGDIGVITVFTDEGITVRLNGRRKRRMFHVEFKP